MRNAILTIILTAVLAVGTTSAFAGAPLNGVYKSSDGDFIEGRETGEWNGGGFLTVGNYLQAFSGEVYPASGTQWKWECPQVVSVNLEADLVFNGFGSKIYSLNYTGGTFGLGGGALPWANGQSYTGSFTTFTEIRTLIFANHVMVGSDSDFSFTGTIDGYPQSCLYGIANGAWLRNTFVGDLDPPDHFPLGGACAGLSRDDQVHLADIRDITLTIGGCTVATEESTWGKVKSLYRD